MGASPSTECSSVLCSSNLRSPWTAPSTPAMTTAIAPMTTRTVVTERAEPGRRASTVAMMKNAAAATPNTMTELVFDTARRTRESPMATTAIETTAMTGVRSGSMRRW
ncbi:unannotated protein [freshwater metagenome]|uniref:Unannotated protein n=1 Tax=freshwater metagenome TaxID=449393 RepID=A0A6J7JL71_9ZZZZ